MFVQQYTYSIHYHQTDCYSQACDLVLMGAHSIDTKSEKKTEKVLTAMSNETNIIVINTTKILSYNVKNHENIIVRLNATKLTFVILNTTKILFVISNTTKIIFVSSNAR